MDYYILTLSSLTSAKRLEKEALYNGILCQVTATPAGISTNGCSNSLRVKGFDVKKALALSKRLNLTVGGVFKIVKTPKGYSYVKQENSYDIF